MEFYANAYGAKDSKAWEKMSMVRGVRVPYNPDWINEKIGNSIISPISSFNRSEGVLDDYTHMRNPGEFDLETTLAKICYENRRITETSHTGVPHKVLRANMTMIFKLWMTFILANLRPKLHPSNLPLEECHLLGCIKTLEITVDPAESFQI
jgi:hypothetical protein